MPPWGMVGVWGGNSPSSHPSPLTSATATVCPKYDATWKGSGWGGCTGGGGGRRGLCQGCCGVHWVMGGGRSVLGVRGVLGYYGVGMLWSTGGGGGSWALWGDGAMGTREPWGAGRGQWGKGALEAVGKALGVMGQGAVGAGCSGCCGVAGQWGRVPWGAGAGQGVTCSLAMPRSWRRVTPTLKISTCPEQRQAPSLSPSWGATPGCPATAVSPPPDIPTQLGTTHLAPRVAFVGDPHHVLCGGREP